MGYFVTGFLWGSTNALMELGSTEIEAEYNLRLTKKEKAEGKRDGIWAESLRMFTRCEFLAPFLIN